MALGLAASGFPTSFPAACRWKHMKGPLSSWAPRLMIFDSAWCTEMCKFQELKKPCCAMYRSMLEFATLTMQRRALLLYCSSQNQTRIFSSSKSSTIAAKLHPKTLPGHDMPVRPRRRSRPLEPAQSFQNEEICSMTAQTSEWRKNGYARKASIGQFRNQVDGPIRPTWQIGSLRERSRSVFQDKSLLLPI